MIKFNVKAHHAAKKMKLMAFDVDGVLSEGSLYYTDNGVEIKAFNGPDGVGLSMLRNAGIELAIITGRESPLVTQRMKDLKIKHVFQGIDDKLTVMTALLEELGLQYDEVGYMGDDIVDLQVLDACGFSAAPADCQERVKEYVQVISNKDGGRGAVREVSEFILDARGELDKALAPYLPIARK